jgi:hypothetical protein
MFKSFGDSFGTLFNSIIYRHWPIFEFIRITTFLKLVQFPSSGEQVNEEIFFCWDFLYSYPQITVFVITNSYYGQSPK